MTPSRRPRSLLRLRTPCARALVALWTALVLPTEVRAQDTYGAAVGVTAAGEAVVLKPGTAMGPARADVYRPAGEGAWTVAGELRPARIADPFSASVAVAGGQVLVGAGDASALFAAHTYARGGEDGAWSPGGTVAFEAREPGPPGAVDVALVFRILQPPARVVAVSADGVFMAAARDANRSREVVLYRADGGGWAEVARLRPDDARPTDRFGAALAVGADGRLAVGAPGAELGAGVVYVFAEGADGHWALETTLRPLVPGAFGSALAWDGTRLWVGAPDASGGGRVSAFEAGRPDRAATELTTATAGPRDRLGAALALADGHLWIGAPGAEGGRGAVLRWDVGEGGRWGPTYAPPHRPDDGAFGAALAAGPGLLVVGAPEAGARRGAAAIVRLDGRGDPVGPPAWVEPGAPLTAVTGGEVACEEGTAAAFSCEGVDLAAYLPIEALGGEPGETVSDLWGWSDPETGREYALVGRTGGIAIVDVTDPSAPRYRGVVPGRPSGARDLKVYRDHLFFTGDGAGAHGMLVFDLTRLREAADEPVTFEPDARYDGIASAHNLALDPESGFAFAVAASAGGNTCGGGLHMIDVRDPLQPTFAGCYTDDIGLLSPGRTHDTQCVVYRGPDADHQGRELCFASNETALRIVDVTDKSAPEPVALARYPGAAYVHQGWLSEDQRYFFLDDELDELVGLTPRTRTLVWDVADIDDPVLVAEFLGNSTATDHNLYVRGDRMYQANYQGGLRVIDIRDPTNPVEVGFFDTTPYGEDPPGFAGAWSAYPWFRSGVVAVSSIREGLFLLRPRRPLVP